MQSASFAVTTLIACGMIVLLLFSTDFRFLPSTSIRPPTTGYSSQISYVGSLESDIYNSTLGFEKLFVINLPQRSDHHDAFALTGALTDIELEYLDGVDGGTVLDKALPPGQGVGFRPASRGSWRAHMNALRSVVERGLGCAVIFEDDVDWDMRIRDQLHDFASSSRALIQPLKSDTKLYADPSFPIATDPAYESTGFDFNDLPNTVAPTVSPYGDDWDILWLGHCGMRRARPGMVEPWAGIAQQIPQGFVYHENDVTVPESHNIHVFDDPGHPGFRQDFKNHTRVVHHAMDAICFLAYAVTQAGARKILYELAIERFDDYFDIMLRQFCDGQAGHEKHVCLTVQPTLFDHYRPAGQVAHDSDTELHEGAERTKGLAYNVRYSTRLNVEKLFKGETDYEDQYPNTEVPLPG